MHTPPGAVETVADLGELAIVARLTTRLKQPRWVVIGPGDDAAVVEPEPRTLEALTTDALVERVHFDRRFVPPEAIGHRALAVNLSDLAAMGARPRAALLSLALPDDFSIDHLDRLMDGLLLLADAERIAVIGGNVTRSPGPLMINITVTGSVRPRRVLRRAGARVGDEVYVTGTLGDAALGLASLQQAHGLIVTGDGRVHRANTRMPRAEGRYLRPMPRVRVGYLLGQQKVATACIDLSDGLADGLRRIAAASGVGVTITPDDVPLSPEMRTWAGGDAHAALTLALSGGDDYELLFTCSPRSRGRLRGIRSLLGDLPVTRIGTVTKGTAVGLETATGLAPLPPSFAHFGQRVSGPPATSQG